MGCFGIILTGEYYTALRKPTFAILTAHTTAIGNDAFCSLLH